MSSSSTDGRSTAEFFRKKKRGLTLVLAGMLALALGAGALTEFRVEKVFTAIPKVAVWVALNFLPDQKALTRLPNILDKLLDTVFMAVTASVTAGIVALALALLGSRTTRVHAVFSWITRVLASVARNIPIVAWALVFLLTFGQSSFTGFLALFFVTLGFLTRAFTETIDEVSASPVEALRAAGATRGQLITQAVFPSSLPQMLSWLLFMIETNIRSATLVGLLTGSGIGFIFDIYYKSLQYRSASLVVIAIVVVTLAIEMVSNALRRVIL